MKATEKPDQDHDHDDKDCRKKDCRKDCHKKDCHKDRCDDHDDKCKHHYRPSHHIYELEKTIKSLADSLAELGRGTHLQELLRIICRPGWTTPAELAFVNTILDHINVEVRTLDRLQADLVEASRKVGYKHK